MQYVHYSFEIAALSVGLWVTFLHSQARKVVPMYIIVVVVCAGFLNDTVSKVIGSEGQNNWHLNVIYKLFETVFLLLFLQYVITKNKPTSKGGYLLFLNVGVVLVWVTLNIVGEKFGQYATQIAAVFGGILGVVGMMAFANLRLAVLRSQFFKTPETWFIFGIIIYHTATCFLFASVPMFTTPEAQQKLLILWGGLQATTSVIKHSSYIYGFYLCRKTLPS